MKPEAVGQHILLDLYDCQSDLSDTTLMESTLVQAAEASNATIVSHHFHTFSPHGVSGVVIIQESHFTIHTWPEHNFASIDIYTCGDEMNFEAGISHLQEELKASKLVKKHFERGNHIIKPLIENE